MELYLAGEVAPPGSLWARDNQHASTMFLTAKQNYDVHQDRVENKGVKVAVYEQADELDDVAVALRLDLQDENDDAEYPSVLNFLPADIYSEILQQEPPTLDGLSIAFPLQHSFQEREEMVSSSKSSLFLAEPPQPKVVLEQMSFWHRKVVELVMSGQEEIVYLFGKAGTAKTECALQICKLMEGRVQAGSVTGKAAGNFNGPTLHAMFGWSYDEDRQVRAGGNETQKLNTLRAFYEGIDVFVIDECNAMSASQLALLDETMRKVFDPEGKLKMKDGTVKRFGGRRMVFLGDSAQLRPVGGAAIYDRGMGDEKGKRSFFSSQKLTRTLKGQELYRKFLVPKCIWLRRGYRNRGLLQEIMDRLRDGQQTEDDLEKLLFLRRKFPMAKADYGIHYSNDSCQAFNCRDLWDTCKTKDPPARLYICKASYFTSADNDLVVSALSIFKPTDFQFASDAVLVAEGCDVRLIKNVDVAAGLCNSCVGTVVKVLFNSCDVSSLLDGKHIPPYCIIVKFASFRGFLTASGERRFPFSDRLCVPLYREKFLPRTIPPWIRKKQPLSRCYREQFPIDLSRHITAHRAQGQTWSDRVVSVDLDLESSNSTVPADIGSVVYVACTRVNDLSKLLVGSIFPNIWERIGKGPQDEARRKEEAVLLESAEKFSTELDSHAEFVEEQSYVADYSGTDDEWKSIVARKTPPTRACEIADEESSMPVTGQPMVGHGDAFTPAWMKPAVVERHIGIDQGDYDFSFCSLFMIW